jgi:hypothetical protein
MKLYLHSSTPSRSNLVLRSNTFRLGTLALAAVFTASQMPAQPAPAATPLAPTQQVADASASTATTAQTNAATAAAVTSAPSDAVKSESNALPEAPATSTANTETASVAMPPNVRAMFNDAVQQSQSMQSAPKSKGVQRPGMLVMGIAGLPLMGLGTWIYAAHGNGGARAAFGSLFFAPGALMSYFGFTLAFKPKN